MNIDVFALWKFKTIEGILKNFYSYDFLVTKYDDGKQKFFIHYDIKAEKATIKSDSIFFMEKSCTFTELPGVLKEMGVYVQDDPKNCHSSAFVPLEVK